MRIVGMVEWRAASGFDGCGDRDGCMDALMDRWIGGMEGIIGNRDQTQERWETLILRLYQPSHVVYDGPINSGYDEERGEWLTLEIIWESQDNSQVRHLVLASLIWINDMRCAGTRGSNF
jgi:hypothetical protein